MELGILGEQLIRFIMRVVLDCRCIGDHVAEPGVLEEMTAKSITGALQRLVATRNPGTALHEIMPAVECWRGEIVVMRVDVETLKGVDRRFCPLPDIADHIVEFSLGKFVDGVTGSEVVEVDIGCRWFSVVDFGQPGYVIEPIPLVFRW